MATRLQPSTKYLGVNGLTLRYLEWGQPAALPVICVHGYTSSAEAFNALARRISDRSHVIAMDVRGHGESAWSPDGAYRYADQASDLASLVDALGIERFVLIGTSMGGIIAMAYAGQHAERLRGLVINDIGPDAEAGTQRITAMVNETIQQTRDLARGLCPVELETNGLQAALHELAARVTKLFNTQCEFDSARRAHKEIGVKSQCHFRMLDKQRI